MLLKSCPVTPQQPQLDHGRPPSLLPLNGFNSPRRVVSVSLYKAGFLFSSREGPRKKRNPWSLPAGGPICSPSRRQPLQGCEGWSRSCRKLNLYAARYMWETSKETRGRLLPLTSAAFPHIQTHCWPLFSAEKQRRPPRLTREPLCTPASNSLLPADLGFLHRAQIGVIDDVLFPVPAPRQGGVLLQDRGVLLLGSRVIL